MAPEDRCSPLMLGGGALERRLLGPSSSNKEPDASGVDFARSAPCGSLNAAACKSTTPESLFIADDELGEATGTLALDGFTLGGGGVAANFARALKLVGSRGRSTCPIL